MKSWKNGMIYAYKVCQKLVLPQKLRNIFRKAKIILKIQEKRLKSSTIYMIIIKYKKQRKINK